MRKKEARENKKEAQENIRPINGAPGTQIPEGTREKAADRRKATVKRLTLGGLLVVLFMLLYIPSFVNWLSGNHVTSDIIRNGTIEEAVSTQGVIVRDEVLLDAPEIGGRYVAEIGEGEKTPANAYVATVLNSTSDALLDEIEEINAKIVKAQMEKAEKADFFSEDLAKLDDEIGSQVQNMITACNSRSFEDMGSYRAEIGRIVEKKAEIVGENTTDNYISSLKAQKETAQKKIGENTAKVRTKQSGIVSYVIDGYETTLTVESLSSLTPDDLERIREEYSQQRENEGRAVAGTPLAKVIKGTDIYIAAVMSLENAKRFEAGKKIKVRINDGQLETTGIIENINLLEKGEAVVSVRLSRGMDVLSSNRLVRISFILKTEEGLKVPLRSLREVSEDGTSANIMLIKFNVAVSRNVDILCRDEEYAVIQTSEDGLELKKTVNLYDIYIINPDHVMEGDIIEK